MKYVSHADLYRLDISFSSLARIGGEQLDPSLFIRGLRDETLLQLSRFVSRQSRTLLKQSKVVRISRASA
jgi:hypothetical protein